MKTFAVLVALAAWGHLLFWRPAPWVSWLLFMAFLVLGSLFTLAGGFSYWWDSGMRPSQRSAVVLVCGLLTLAAQAGRLFKSLSDDDLG